MRKEKKDNYSSLESKYNLVMSMTNALIYEYDIVSGKILWSGEVKRITGFNSDEFGKNIEDWSNSIYPDDRDYANKELDKSIKKHHKYNVNYRIKIKSGDYIWVEDIGKFLYDSNNKPYKMIGRMHNITESKKIEDELRKSEEKFKSIFDSSPFGMHMYELKSNGDLVFIDANKSADKILKVKNNNFIGKTIGKAFPDLLKTNIPQAYKKVILSGKDWHDSQVNYSEGKILGAFDVYAFKIGKNKMVTSFIDITEKKKNEEKIILKNKVFDSAISANSISDINGKITEVNTSFLKIWGYSKVEEVIGRSVNSFFLDPKEVLPILDSLKKNGFWKGEYKAKKKNGSFFIAQSIATTIRDANGKLIGYQSAVNDITENKKNESQARGYLERLKIASRAGKIGIWDWDIIKDELVWDDTICELYGVPHGYFKGGAGKWSKHIIPEDRDYALAELQAALRGEKEYCPEFRIKWPNGEIHYIKANSQTFFDENRKAVRMVGTNIDITDRKKIEYKIRESEETFRGIFENTNVGVSIVGIDGKWLKVNKQLCKMLGYSEEDLLLRKFNSITHPDDIKKSTDLYKNLVENKIINSKLEKRYITKDGKIIWVLLSITLTLNGNNKPKYFVVVTQDITENKELDEAKSGFLSLASHQLRTPLSMTKWLLESILYKRDDLNEKLVGKLNDLNYSNERLIKLVNNLLSVSSIDTGKLNVEKKNVNISILLTNLIYSVKGLADSKNKIIKMSVPKESLFLYCDPILVNEAVENILTNAINYSEENSKIIKIRADVNKEGILISINNSGVIDTETREKISNFDKFIRGENSTEKQPAGSGLGLYITKKVIEANGGSVRFNSNVEDGTTFYIQINK